MELINWIGEQLRIALENQDQSLANKYKHVKLEMAGNRIVTAEELAEMIADWEEQAKHDYANRSQRQDWCDFWNIFIPKATSYIESQNV